MKRPPVIIDVPENMFILDIVGKEVGLHPRCKHYNFPCLSCHGKVTSGTVYQTYHNTFSREDTEDGFVLLCKTYPTSDVTIKTCQM